MVSEPQAVDLLVQASWAVPVVPQDTILRDHALVVHDGRIVDLLPADLASKRYTPAVARSLTGHCLLPGLVNAHTHASMTLLRGYADDLPLATWLEQHIWPAESRWVGAEFVTDGARLAVAEMLCGGTTCFADMYYFPDRVAQVAADTGIRAQLAFPIFDAPSAWGQDAAEYISRGLRVRDEFRANPRLSFAFGLHAPYTNSNETLERIAILSAQLDAPVHIHLHETANEITDSIAQHGQRPLARLLELGLVTDRLQAVHMTQVSDEDLTILREYSAQVVHCPSSNMKLASGRCPLERLMAMDVAFGIGTDGAASNNTLDMLAETRLAALLAKSGSGDPTTLGAHAALRAATLGGARALGLAGRIGSLELGKDADFISVDLNGIASNPVHDPASQLVYTGNSAQVANAWVEGRALLSEGELTEMDENQIRDAAQGWRSRLADIND